MIAFVVTGFLTAPPANAREDIRNLSCSNVQRLVKRKGAVVLSFTDTRYDRVVRNASYCDHGQAVKTIYQSTKDKEKCRIGFQCIGAEEADLFINRPR